MSNIETAGRTMQLDTTLYNHYDIRQHATLTHNPPYHVYDYITLRSRNTCRRAQKEGEPWEGKARTAGWARTLWPRLRAGGNNCPIIQVWAPYLHFPLLYGQEFLVAGVIGEGDFEVSRSEKREMATQGLVPGPRCAGEEEAAFRPIYTCSNNNESRDTFFLPPSLTRRVLLVIKDDHDHA